MGKGSSKSPPQEGASRADGEAPDQIQRRLRGTRRKVSYRLKHVREHERVRHHGRRTQFPLLTVWKAAGATSHPRVAVIVPLHGNSAVARNRLKRRLHHILREDILSIAGVLDIVVRARPPAYSAGFQELRNGLIEAFE